MTAILDTKTAAAEMGVAPSTIRDWVSKGWLPVATRAQGRGRKSLYWRDDVLKAELRARRGEGVARRS